MPRQKKQEAVIPTTSLVASATRYPGKAARIFRPNQDWQRDCYRHYAICGEARFAARFFGHALSRATLGIEKPATGNKGGFQPVTSGPSVELLDNLFNGKDGQSQMLESLGLHLTIAGECYLVGRTVEGEDTWEIVSIVEMKVTGQKWSIDYGDSMQPVVLEDSDVVIRIWIPNPEKRIEADSPFKSMLPVLTEIEWLTRNIFAQVSSRLAGAGILFVPQGMSFPPPPEVEGVPQETANEADAFMLTLADTMIRPLSDPGAPEAMIPLIVTAPDDAIDKAKLMHFWSNLDEKALEMRTAAIMRFADGMELPKEQVLGMSSNPGTGGGTTNGVSHWGAWQIEESTIKMFVEPMLEQVVNALTIGYLRPLSDDNRLTEKVGYNTSALRLRPDRSKEAFELYDRGALSKVALLRETGFSDADLPDDDEFKEWLVRKIAGGSATPDMVAAALAILGIDLPVAAPVVPEMPTQAPLPPSLEDHPTQERVPDMALLAASEGLVYRALERAGNRLRNEGAKPPGVRSYETHCYVRANGKSASVLEDAWSCAPQVLDGLVPDVDGAVQTLNSYVLTLLSEQAPHSRDRLKQWLELAIR